MSGCGIFVLALRAHPGGPPTPSARTIEEVAAAMSPGCVVVLDHDPEAERAATRDAICRDALARLSGLEPGRDFVLRRRSLD